METQNTEPGPLEERLQSQARSVDLRQAVMACLTGKESRRWRVAELVERLKAWAFALHVPA